mgnify:CR=1 FL=1
MFVIKIIKMKIKILKGFLMLLMLGVIVYTIFGIREVPEGHESKLINENTKEMTVFTALKPMRQGQKDSILLKISELTPDCGEIATISLGDNVFPKYYISSNLDGKLFTWKVYPDGQITFLEKNINVVDAYKK